MLWSIDHHHRNTIQIPLVCVQSFGTLISPLHYHPQLFLLAIYNPILNSTGSLTNRQNRALSSKTRLVFLSSALYFHVNAIFTPVLAYYLSGEKKTRNLMNVFTEYIILFPFFSGVVVVLCWYTWVKIHARILLRHSFYRAFANPACVE